MYVSSNIFLFDLKIILPTYTGSCRLYQTLFYFSFFKSFFKTEFNKNFFLLRNLFNLEFNHIYLPLKKKKWGKKLQKVARGPKTGKKW